MQDIDSTNNLVLKKISASAETITLNRDNSLYKAVIFDMDGVLLDSQHLHYQSDIAVLAKAGYQADMSTVIPYTGISNLERWPKYREDLGLEATTQTLIYWCNQMVTDIFNSAQLEPLPGIPELLNHISRKNLKIGLGSASHPWLIKLVLSKLGIAHYFSAVVSCEEVGRGKPAPDVFLHAAKKLGEPAKYCVVIEDSQVGVQSAKNAGMTCIAYCNPSVHTQDVSLADYVVKNFKECLEWL